MATRKTAAPVKRPKAKTSKPAVIAKVKVTPKGDREFVITRRFAAPRALVFDAFSKPEMVKQWLNGPPGWTMDVCEIDFRVGGKYRYVWSNSAGPDKGMGLGGVYKEIKRPERIVNTEKFDPAWYAGEALSTLELTEEKSITLMTLTARYGSKKTRDEILASPMEGGLEFSYRELDTLLKKQGGGKARKENALYTGVSEPASVEAYMKSLKHPLRGVANQLRSTILGADKAIGEGIFWNAPTFYYTGPMKPFDPKTYKRYIVGFNFFKQDCIRLIFLRGADVKDPKGILEGKYTDGRRLMLIRSLAASSRKRRTSSASSRNSSRATSKGRRFAAPIIPSTMITSPEVTTTKEQPTASIHLVIPGMDMPKHMDAAILEIIQLLADQGMRPMGPMFSYHHRRPSDTFDFEIGFPVAKAIAESGRVKNSTLPAEKVARAVYQGPYEGLSQAWPALQKWVREQGLSETGRFFERYLNNPDEVNDPREFRTELNWVIG